MILLRSERQIYLKTMYSRVSAFTKRLAFGKTAFQDHNLWPRGFALESSMVKVWGQNLNMNSIKQTAKISKSGQKILSGGDAAGFMSLVLGVQHSRLRIDLELFRPGEFRCTTVRSPMKKFQLIININESLAWHCMIATCTTDVTNSRTCQFFAICLTVFPFGFRPRILPKKSIKPRLMILECSFPLKDQPTSEGNLCYRFGQHH